MNFLSGLQWSWVNHPKMWCRFFVPQNHEPSWTTKKRHQKAPKPDRFEHGDRFEGGRLWDSRLYQRLDLRTSVASDLPGRAALGPGPELRTLGAGETTGAGADGGGAADEAWLRAGWLQAGVKHGETETEDVGRWVLDDVGCWMDVSGIFRHWADDNVQGLSKCEVPLSDLLLFTRVHIWMDMASLSFRKVLHFWSFLYHDEDSQARDTGE